MIDLFTFSKGEVQKKNASIALQLSRAFLNKTQKDNTEEKKNVKKVTCDPFKINVKEALGLRLCAWPGRSQTVPLSRDVVFFLDGAHTRESAQVSKFIFFH